MLIYIITAASPTSAAPDVDVDPNIKSAAESGDAQAQFDLALSYFRSSKDEAQDYAKTVEWLRKSADQGHAKAQAYLGSCYANGYGVHSDYVEAVKWFRKAADQQQVQALNALGYCYATGHGVPQDQHKAIKWYRMAAIQNDAQSQYNLGYSYYYGQGIAQNYIKAVKWLQRSAEQNYAPAQYLMGLCLSKGQGSGQNIINAFAWLNIAARTMDEAEKSRQELVARMSPQQILLGISATTEKLKQIEPRLQYASIAELQLLSSRGNIEAQVCLGNCYAEGRGVDQSMSDAVSWWAKAAEQNDAEAQLKLGSCYAEANGVERNYEQAVKWFHQAASQGNAQAQYRLGYAYYTGQGVDRDYNEAVEWFRKSAGLNYVPAQYQMGRCSASGQGMNQNLVTAFAWWSLALESDKEAARERESLSQKMTPRQIFAGMHLSQKYRKEIAVRMLEHNLQPPKTVVQSDSSDFKLIHARTVQGSQDKHQKTETASSM